MNNPIHANAARSRTLAQLGASHGQGGTFFRAPSSQWSVSSLVSRADKAQPAFYFLHRRHLRSNDRTGALSALSSDARSYFSRFVTLSRIASLRSLLFMVNLHYGCGTPTRCSTWRIGSMFSLATTSSCENESGSTI